MLSCPGAALPPAVLRVRVCAEATGRMGGAGGRVTFWVQADQQLGWDWESLDANEWNNRDPKLQPSISNQPLEGRRETTLKTQKRLRKPTSNMNSSFGPVLGLSYHNGPVSCCGMKLAGAARWGEVMGFLQDPHHCRAPVPYWPMTWKPSLLIALLQQLLLWAEPGRSYPGWDGENIGVET